MPGGRLLSGSDFWLDSKALGRYFLADLPTRLEDLLRVSMAIYAVDRLAPRRWGESQSWGRDLLVRVEMLDPGFWSGAEVLDALQQAVEFVGGDSWDFEFVGDRYRHEWSRPLLSKVFAGESPLVCLYSGDWTRRRGWAYGCVIARTGPRSP